MQRLRKLCRLDWFKGARGGIQMDVSAYEGRLHALRQCMCRWIVGMSHLHACFRTCSFVNCIFIIFRFNLGFERRGVFSVSSKTVAVDVHPSRWS